MIWKRSCRNGGVDVDHATLNRWVIEFGLLLAEEAQKCKQQTASSSRMDETYTNVEGRWTYLYRAVDKVSKTLDFMLSEQRDEAAAEVFFRQSVGNNGVPDKVVIDKSGANQARLLNINLLLFFLGFWPLIEILQVKYLHNMVEQDHRFIKKFTKPMKGFKAFHSAAATLQGIEVAHMIRK